MAALPAAPFDACHQASGQVSSQSLVHYQNAESAVASRGVASTGHSRLQENNEEQKGAPDDKLPASALPERVRSEEWEPVLREALESLFPVSVLRTGGRNEHGADIEIVISNPFEENRDWIVAVQVKDYEGKVGAEVADQLVDAYESRSQHSQVIAVVLLVSNADASEALDARMRELSEHFRVPFVFCGRDLFLRLLARGFLRRS